MPTNIEIAQQAKRLPIVDIAQRIGLSPADLIPYGHHIAKLNHATVTALTLLPPRGQLILVTAINPTPAGEGKTTTTIGLTDALNALGQSAMACLREPSLGPVFGLKGGATGGGQAQVLPMEEINLHFTGDFHAISAANNLLAALIDNHIYHGNPLDIQQVTWRRCVDMNDRALRQIHLADGSERGFDITVASEVMAIFCLAQSLADLKNRLGRIQIGCNGLGQAIYASDLAAEGAMTALLKEAFLPNLVQTIAGSPALIHGGPFANIAHGCNSLLATQTALRLADYVVTEAGFGADLGAEKFMDIKCRLAGFRPGVAVVVATIRALKYHGGEALAALNQENLTALKTGFANLQRHIDNLSHQFGLRVLVALNHFAADTPAEVALLTQLVAQTGASLTVCRHWAEGASGALELAQKVVETLQTPHPAARLLYADEASLLKKLQTIACQYYGASGVALSDEAQAQLAQLSVEEQRLPVCVAKTPYSFSGDANLKNAPSAFVLEVRALRLSRGAGFVVAICGNLMTMPGLPVHPASAHIDVNADGLIVGLS